MDGFFSWRCLYDNNEVYFYASIKNNIKSNVFDLGTEIEIYFCSSFFYKKVTNGWILELRCQYDPIEEYFFNLVNKLILEGMCLF